MQNTARRAISYPDLTRDDRPDVPLHLSNLATALDVDVLYTQGTDAARVAAAHQLSGGRFWFTTDTDNLFYDDGTSWWLVGGASTITPPGVLVPYAGAAAPTGWVLCDGSAISRTTFANLFAAIGVVYGAGNGTTTFNVPDMRGRVPVGKNAATFVTLGGVGGEETHLLSTPELPVHTHVISSDSAGTPAGTLNAVSAGTPAGTLSTDSAGTPAGTIGNETANHTHSGTTSGVSAFHTHSQAETRNTVNGQSYGAGSFPYGTNILTSVTSTDSTDHSHNITTGIESTTHNHLFTGTAMTGHTHTFTGTAMGTHVHTFTGTALGTHTHTISNTGAGTAHNNLQPYNVVNYIIKT